MSVSNILKTASSSDIRRAYRRLSLKLHPDHNKDPNAATQFRQVFKKVLYKQVPNTTLESYTS